MKKLLYRKQNEQNTTELRIYIHANIKLKSVFDRRIFDLSKDHLVLGKKSTIHYGNRKFRNSGTIVFPNTSLC